VEAAGTLRGRYYLHMNLKEALAKLESMGDEKRQS
jgi:hypothetical protein